MKKLGMPVGQEYLQSFTIVGVHLASARGEVFEMGGGKFEKSLRSYLDNLRMPQ